MKCLPFNTDVAIIPKVAASFAPSTQDRKSKFKLRQDLLGGAVAALPADLKAHWKGAHLALPKLREAHVLDYGGQRVVYNKAPVYAEGAQARCYVGQREDSTFCLVRRLNVSVADDGCELISPEALCVMRETQATLSPAATPAWTVAVPSSKAEGHYKVYAVENLLPGSCASMAEHLLRSGLPAANFVHHVLHNVLTQLRNMHGGRNIAGTRVLEEIGYAHNDVKTGNVLLRDVPEDHEPLLAGTAVNYTLIDFDLAEVCGEECVSNMNIRPSELVEGDAKARGISDMFSLGLMGIELLIGESPYGFIANQAITDDLFIDQHLELLNIFEAARARAEAGDLNIEGLNPLETRFVRMWSRVQETAPPYLAALLNACTRKDFDSEGPMQRSTAAQALAQLEDNPLPAREIGRLNVGYRAFVDKKQALAKVSAALQAQTLKRSEELAAQMRRAAGTAPRGAR